MGASVSCYACLVWCGRPEYNAVYNAIGGMYNVVSVVILIVYVDENGTLHSLYIMWL